MSDLADCVFGVHTEEPPLQPAQGRRRVRKRESKKEWTNCGTMAGKRAVALLCQEIGKQNGKKRPGEISPIKMFNPKL